MQSWRTYANLKPKIPSPTWTVLKGYKTYKLITENLRLRTQSTRHAKTISPIIYCILRRYKLLFLTKFVLLLRNIVSFPGTDWMSDLNWLPCVAALIAIQPAVAHQKGFNMAVNKSYLYSSWQVIANLTFYFYSKTDPCLSQAPTVAIRIHPVDHFRFGWHTPQIPQCSGSMGQGFVVLASRARWYYFQR